MPDNTPPGFEDPALLESQYDYMFTDDEYLIEELPHTAHLNTEPKELENE